MPAMWKDKGSCPVCGTDVPRLMTMLHGRMREIYTCPAHGAVAYGVQSVTVEEWNALSRGRILAAITP